MESNPKKGRVTFRITAVLFILSAVFEVISLNSEALLFNAIRGGIIAVVYHLFYVAMFAALGFSLWNAAKWGYPLIFAATIIYTLDKLQLLMNQTTVETLVERALAGNQSVLQAQGITQALLVQSIMLMTVVVIVCWWGFALYTYWRRDYFK